MKKSDKPAVPDDIIHRSEEEIEEIRRKAKDFVERLNQHYDKERKVRIV